MPIPPDRELLNIRPLSCLMLCRLMVNILCSLNGIVESASVAKARRRVIPNTWPLIFELDRAVAIIVLQIRWLEMGANSHEFVTLEDDRRRLCLLPRLRVRFGSKSGTCHGAVATNGMKEDIANLPDGVSWHLERIRLVFQRRQPVRSLSYKSGQLRRLAPIKGVIFLP
jgi:hypothetical protein